MVNWAGIGAGLEVAGGLKGLFGGKAPSPSQQAYGQLKGAFRAADEFGLHRLAVAGSPAGYTPVPSQAAEGLMAAGGALRSYSEGKETGRLRRKEEELIDAQIEEARSRTILNNANARRAFAGPQPGLGGAATRMGVAFDRLANGGDRAISREPERDMPASQTVTAGSQTARGPNPEAFEVGLSELIAGALIYGPQWLYGAMGGGSLNSNRSGTGGQSRPGRRNGPRPNQPGYRP